jgi:GPH family glycoside/pentoside/hexuronide:cation symporter
MEFSAESQAEAAASPRTPRLGVQVKFFYGLGSVAFGVESVALGSLVLLYFNQVIGLPASWVGAAIMVALIFDAIFDPLLGHWSDHLRSPWGRRHPFMYASAAPLAVAFYFLWRPPRGWSNEALLAYLLAGLVSVRLLVSLYEIPSAALAPELTPDYDERTSLLAYRFFFGVLGGTAMSVAAFQIFLRKDAAHPLGVLNRHGYEQFGLLSAIVMFAAIIVTCVGTHGRGVAATVRNETDDFRDKMREIRTTLSNRSFFALMMAGIVASIAVGLNSGLGLYVTTYFWELTPKQISYLVSFGFVSAILGVSLATPASKWLGKKKAMLALFTISAIAGSIPIPLRLIGLMPANHTDALLAALFADGVVRDTLGIMGFIIVASMMADVVEDIAVKSGRRSEGLIFAANGLLQKCVTGFGTFLSGLMLGWAHFPQGAIQGHVAQPILRHLVLIFVPVSVSCNAIALIILTFYNIDRAAHQRNLERLRDAAALVELGNVEAEEGIPPATRVV